MQWFEIFGGMGQMLQMPSYPWLCACAYV